MINEEEDVMLQHSLREIEKILEWGPSCKWTTRDFNDLSEKIHEKTGVALSVTTLKRIWGKVLYKSKPTTATLNALVHFAGYENWQSFNQKHAEVITFNQYQDIAKDKYPFNITKGKKLLIVAAVVLAATTGFFLMFVEPDISGSTKVKADLPYIFSSKMMVSEGVPNSIIFNYNAMAAAPGDSIYIQQSWDKRLSKKVSREENIHSSIYYYPGYFQAKLVVNNEIVKEQELYIKTKGWLPLIEQDREPVYFGINDMFNDEGILHLSTERIKEKNILLQPETPWLSYFNIKDFGDINTDNFIFETEIRNDYKEGSAMCQHSEIHILFQGGVFLVPLSNKGCVSDLRMYDAKGKIDDPSVLGCNLSNWVKVRYQVKNKKGQLYIDDKLAYNNMDLDLPILKIMGLRYRFQGTGSVKFLKFSNANGEIVYEEDFQI